VVVRDIERWSCAHAGLLQTILPTVLGNAKRGSAFVRRTSMVIRAGHWQPVSLAVSIEIAKILLREDDQ
jgi:hypothetical protein